MKEIRYRCILHIEDVARKILNKYLQYVLGLCTFQLNFLICT